MGNGWTSAHVVFQLETQKVPVKPLQSASVTEYAAPYLVMQLSIGQIVAVDWKPVCTRWRQKVLGC
eukprot:4466762-Amphidinium_carterae.2